MRNLICRFIYAAGMLLVLLMHPAVSSAVPGDEIIYLKGQQRLLVKVTAPDTATALTLPAYHTLTNSQRVLEHGRNSDGQYMLLELKVNLPEVINTDCRPPVRGSVPDSIERYLRPARDIQINHERITGRVKKILKGRTFARQHEIVEALMIWVAKNIDYHYGDYWEQSAVEVLMRKGGNCAGYANLCVALLRGAGIPCRRMGCYIPPDCGWGDDDEGGLHAFIQVHYSDIGWLCYDPQKTLHFVEPFHLVTEIGDGEWTELPGNLSFEILEDDADITGIPISARVEMLLSASVGEGRNFSRKTMNYSFPYMRKDGKVIRSLCNGDSRIKYPDGGEQYVSADGSRSEIMSSRELEKIYRPPVHDMGVDLLFSHRNKSIAFDANQFNMGVSDGIFYCGLQLWLGRGFGASILTGRQFSSQVFYSSGMFKSWESRYRDSNTMIVLDIPVPLLPFSNAGIWLQAGFETMTRKYVNEDNMLFRKEQFQAFKLGGSYKFWIKRKAGIEYFYGYRWLDKSKDYKSVKKHFDDFYLGFRLFVKLT